MFDKLTVFLRGHESLLYSKIKKLNCNKVNIYGTGEFGRELIYLIERENQVAIDKLFDRNAEHFSFDVEGKNVLKPEEIGSLDEGEILVIASEAFKDSMLQTAKEFINGKNIQIVSLVK